MVTQRLFTTFRGEHTNYLPSEISRKLVWFGKVICKVTYRDLTGKPHTRLNWLVGSKRDDTDFVWKLGDKSNPFSCLWGGKGEGSLLNQGTAHRAGVRLKLHVEQKCRTISL